MGWGGSVSSWPCSLEDEAEEGPVSLSVGSSISGESVAIFSFFKFSFLLDQQGGKKGKYF
jgi:hypothetical protein